MGREVTEKQRCAPFGEDIDPVTLAPDDGAIHC
jgi:hypothetical protein